jgi:hypothetical protein
MLIAGAPVANRAWALEQWFRCLAYQTVRPDGVAFIHSGQVGDDTWHALFAEADRHGFDISVVHDPRAPHQRTDSARFSTLADLRNRLLELARDTMRANRFLSLDTDIMLEDLGTLERLGGMLDEGADLASVATAFHPLASDPNAEVDGQCWAYNAGWLNRSLPDRSFERPPPDQIPWGETIKIEIPMGVWLATRQVIDTCRYRAHQCGEDIGFAQDLDEHGFECWWDTSIYAPHIWQESHLRKLTHA